MGSTSKLVKVAVAAFVGVIAGAFLAIGAIIGLFASLVVLGILIALFIVVFLVAAVDSMFQKGKK